MAWTAVNQAPIQISKNAGGAAASDYYFKFYAAGTTTPINMATDSTGGTTLAKCQLNSLGYPTTDGSTVFVPHIDQDYKLALYTNSTDADNNTLASAAWVVDNLSTSGTATITNTAGTTLTPTQWVDRQVQTFSTVAALSAATTLSAGDYVSIENYTATNNSGPMFGEIVAAATGTDDGGTYIDLTGSNTQFKQSFNDNVVNVKKFGAEGDNSTDDTSAIQSAISSRGTSSVFGTTGGKVYLPKGRYKTTSPLKIKSSWVTIEGEGEYATILDFTGGVSEACLECDAAITNVYSYINIRNLGIRVNQAYGRGIRWDLCQYSRFEGLSVNLLDDNTVGFYGAGNGAGSAPYYNSFDNLNVIGSWTPSAPTTDCVGFRFILTNPDQLDAPNSNMFSNFKRMASLNMGFDIQAGTGNMFSNIGIESIGDYVFDFGDKLADFTGTATSGTANTITDTGANFNTLSNGTLRIISGTGAGTVASILNNTATTITLSQAQPFVFDNTSVYYVYNGRCAENNVINLRHEGTNTTALVRNNYGSHSNTISNVFSTSATTRWINLAKDPDTVVNPKGSHISSHTFTIENLPSNTTTKLSPIGGAGFAFEGGIRIPMTGNIIAATTAVNNMSSGALGEATVKVIHNGSETTAVTHTINANNRYGYSAVADVIDDPVLKDKNIHVEIDTDASWNATGADFSVTVWIAH